MAAVGYYHSLCLSDEGSLFSFGRNDNGQLGHSNNQEYSLPKQIEGLPPICLVSCGEYFTACVDDSGSLWTFGANNYGQLGLGHCNNQNQAQRVASLPPLLSVHCGAYHCICVTQNSSIWSFGQNSYGELALGHNRTPQSSPQLVPPLPEPIQHISCGYGHSLFLSQTGCVFGSGRNEDGQLGVGGTSHRSTPTMIPKLPPITSVSCGAYNSAFLCSGGEVYTTGFNNNGELGLGHTSNQSTSTKVPGLSNIVFISCGRNQTRCIDKEGILYCWGHNSYGSLGLGDSTDRNKPSQSNIKNIQSLSEGSCSQHCLVKHTDGSISAFGLNRNGQLGLGDKNNKNSPQLVDKKHNNMFEREKRPGSRKWKEVAKEVRWTDSDITNLLAVEELLSKVDIEQLKSKSEAKRIKGPEGGDWAKWKQVQAFLVHKQSEIETLWNQSDTIHKRNEEEVNTVRKEKEELEKKLEEVNKRLPLLIERMDNHQQAMKYVGESFETLQHLNESVRRLCENEEELEGAFCDLLQRKPLDQVNEEEMDLVLWKMNLSEYYPMFLENNINGKAISCIGCGLLPEFGMKYKDACTILYYRELMTCKGYVASIQSRKEVECMVCSHSTVKQTLELVNEDGYNFPSSMKQIIEEKKWTTPSLIYADSLKEFNITIKDRITVVETLSIWKQIHEEHLKSIS